MRTTSQQRRARKPPRLPELEEVHEDEYVSLASEDEDVPYINADTADTADKTIGEDDPELSMHARLDTVPSLALPDVGTSPLLQRRQSRHAQHGDVSGSQVDLDVSAVSLDSDASCDELETDAELRDTTLPAPSEVLAGEDNIRVGLMSVVLDSIHRYQDDVEVLSLGQLDLIFTPDTVLAMVDDPEAELRVMAVQIVDFCLRRRVPNFTRRFLRAQGFQVGRVLSITNCG